jgi:hypothetical protein
MIIRIPPIGEILNRWHEIEPLLQRATARTHGCYEPEDVLAMVFSGRGTMLLIEDQEGGDLLVVVVTEVRQHPRKRVIDVNFIGGVLSNDSGLREWAPMLVERLEEMARQIGATLLSGVGRVGWARVGGFKIIGGYSVRDVAMKEQDNG